MSQIWRYGRVTSKRERKYKRRCPTCGGEMRYEKASLSPTLGDRLAARIFTRYCPKKGKADIINGSWVKGVSYESS